MTVVSGRMAGRYDIFLLLSLENGFEGHNIASLQPLKLASILVEKFPPKEPPRVSYPVPGPLPSSLGMIFMSI